MPCPSRIRIGYCIDSLAVGGTELNAIRTLEAFDREQFEFTVFHLHRDGALRARYEALGVRMVHLPISRLYAPRTARQGWRFARLLRHYAVQVVHTHDLYTNILAVPWARLAGRQVIASRRWLYDAPRPGLVPLNRWACKLADRILANSSAVAGVLAEEGVRTAKIVRIPNFVGARAFARLAPDERAAQRRAWGMPEDAFVVGSVARLAAVKNHQMLLRALCGLSAQIHVLLIGDGPTRAALARLADELGIGARVHFAGEILAVNNLHQYLDVSVLCSRSEGFPNAVLEALAAQVPVVATAVGGVTDIVTDGESGLLVAVDDVDALRARLQALATDAALRRRLAVAGVARAQSTYSEGAVMSQLAGLYQELAAAPVQHAFAGS
ncbi:MAG TPA: glycosyltransferase [Steroidobacteraceae bacterium]|nr:glycosyltransferase [Steroidobacteraceae bacterium]